MLKGNAGHMSDVLKEKFYEEKKEKQRKMKADEQARKEVMNALMEEEKRLKTEKVMKKQELRKIQDEDHQKKQEYAQLKEQKYKVDDFGDHNVFSYIYSTKVHKSHELGEKKDKVIEMMKDQFMASRHDPAVLEDHVLKQRRDMFKKQEQQELDKAKTRKDKEMETKLF